MILFIFGEISNYNIAQYFNQTIFIFIVAFIINRKTYNQVYLNQMYNIVIIYYSHIIYIVFSGEKKMV